MLPPLAQLWSERVRCCELRTCWKPTPCVCACPSCSEQGVDAAGEAKSLPKKGGWGWAEIAQDCDEFIKVAQEFW